MVRITRLFLLLVIPLIGILLGTRYQKTLFYPKGKSGFRFEQQKNARVKTAYEKTWPGISAQLKKINIDTGKFQLLIRAFKDEAELEVWVKSAAQTTYSLYKTYPICAASGELGPKRCQGDGQVPEGFYHVNVFNPYSNYHLSLGVSYPNASDKVFACKRDAGGAIMIHGDCVTIGCIPLTDEKIREVYVMAVEAKHNGQTTIPIQIFPARLTDKKLSTLKTQFSDKKLHTFWANLKTGYDWFETKKYPAKVTIDAAGNYIFE
jgi:murein L,D-transpeptidase YafK